MFRQAADDAREREVDDEVDERDEGEDEKDVGSGEADFLRENAHEDFRVEEEFGDGELGKETGVFDSGDDLAHQAGDDTAEGLREDDAGESLHEVESLRAGRFKLAFGD